MHPKAIVLLTLFIGISGWMLWACTPGASNNPVADDHFTSLLNPQLTPHASVADSPLVQEPQRYEGLSLNPAAPAFEVWYDPALWQLTEGRTGMNYLVHRTIENCSLDLVGTRTEATL